ncbi:MAG: EamA family transporter, partial [Alphaproteobacteria bacterium]
MTGAAARTAGKVPVAIRATLWMVAASACFTVMSACIRPVADELHSFEILFLRSLFAFLLMSPWMLRVGWASLRTRRIGLYVLRAGLFLLSSLIWIYVLPRIPLVDAIALGFTAPFFATVLAALLLGEVVRMRRWT